MLASSVDTAHLSISDYLFLLLHGVAGSDFFFFATDCSTGDGEDTQSFWEGMASTCSSLAVSIMGLFLGLPTGLFTGGAFLMGCRVKSGLGVGFGVPGGRGEKNILVLD